MPGTTKRFLKNSWTLMIASLLLGCAQSVDPADQSSVRGLVGKLLIHSTDPVNGQTGVCLDHRFKVIFEEKVDAYSAVPDNFEVWTTTGNRVGGERLVSTKFIPHPNDSSKTVSEVTVTFPDTYLSPGQEYYLVWGEPRTDVPDVNPAALGIQNLIGYRAESGSVRFQTENCLNDVNSQKFELLSVSPGRILTRGKVFDIEGELDNLINRDKNNSFITLQKNAKIRMTFNQPIDRIPGVDPVSGPLGEIRDQPLDEFPSLAIFVIDANTRFDQLYYSLLNLDQNAWEAFRTSFGERLQGTLSTTDGRRTILFELAPGESYPDTVAQAVVVVARDILALNAPSSANQLEDNLAIASFIHFSGFGFESPVSFFYDQLFNQAQESNP